MTNALLHRVLRMPRSRQEKMTGPLLFVPLAGLAIFLGLVPAFLGVDSLLSATAICVVLTTTLFFLLVVTAAAMGNKWSLAAFLALSVFLIDATFRQREISSQSIDMQTLMKIFVWCCSMTIAFLATPNLVARLFHGDMKWVTMLAILIICSTAYSLTPTYTFGGGIAAISYCTLAVCVTEKLSKEMILLSFLAGLTLVLAASLGMYAMGTGMAVMEGGAVLRLGGLTGSPNSLGRAASLTLLLIGVLLIYGQISAWNWRCWIPASLALACLVLADSRTSMAVVLVSFALYFVRMRPRASLVAVLGLTLIGILLLNIDIPWRDFGAAFSRAGRTSDLTTLTGRTDIWSVSIRAFLQKPLLGYGFGSTKVLFPEIYRTYWGFTVSHAHNLYIQTAVTLGLVGLFFVLTILIKQISSYFSRPDAFKTVVLGFILVHGMTEPGPIGTAPNVVTFFWALSLCWDRVLEPKNDALEDQPFCTEFTS